MQHLAQLAARANTETLCHSNSKQRRSLFGIGGSYAEVQSSPKKIRIATLVEAIRITTVRQSKTCTQRLKVHLLLLIDAVHHALHPAAYE